MPGNDVRPHPMPEKIRANRSVGERLSRESTHNQNIIFATYRRDDLVLSTPSPDWLARHIL